MPSGRVLALSVLVGAVSGGCSLEPRRGDPPGGERGRRAELLVESAGCVACHRAPGGLAERIEVVPAPDLGAIGARVTPQHLRTLLENPQAARPGTRMPDLLAGLPDEERPVAREELLHFLVARGGPIDQSAVEVDAGSIERGRLAYHELGCAACHAPLEEAWQLEYLHWVLEGDDAPTGPDVEELVEAAAPAPWTVTPLGDLRRRTTVTALAEFLMDPHATRPNGRMPSLDLAQAEALDIARYLLRDGELARASLAAGLAVEVFMGDFGEAGPDYDALTPSALLVVSGTQELAAPREDQFAFRLRGFLEVERAGTYTFASTSDDGSLLSLDGELLIDNGGTHAPQRVEGTRWLDSGPHSLELTWFEYTGGHELAVDWSGPGFERKPLPAERLSHNAQRLAPREREDFEVQVLLAARGADRFASLGCGACHTLDGQPTGAPVAPELVELDADARAGCLGTLPGAGVPRYTLASDERELLAELVAGASGPWPALDEHEHIARTLERGSCLACHARDGVGGPAPARQAYFVTRGAADLGDEGRLPPTLEGVGAKLTHAALSGVLVHGERVRPYMATRMPNYPVDFTAPLVELFERDDAGRLGPNPIPADVSDVEFGPHLAGVRGLGCIQCHTFAGQASLGIPAVDLADVGRRLRPEWFHMLLADPEALGMNSRMPQFWSDGVSPVRDVLDGDPELQIAALWNYLSLGHAALLPEGLVVPDEAFEIEVGDVPVAVGVFMAGVSPRTLCVGFPERTHYAFDMQNSRLARAWRGRFFNARGTWEGRAGALEHPPSSDVLDLPSGPVFAQLDAADAAWPVDTNAHALGRRYDSARRPVLRYALGHVTIEETVQPELRPGASWLRRSFRLSAPQQPLGLWMRAAVAPMIQQDEDRTWVVDGGLRLDLPEGARLRLVGERNELLVPIAFQPAGDSWTAELEVAFTW